jgi:hypothetical protein
LTAQYRDVFLFDAVVSSLDGSPLQGPFVFHLHDSYPRPVIWVRKTRPDNTASLESITSTGVYTLAVQVKDAKGKWMGLEFDLRRLPRLAKRFHSR